MVTKRHPSLQPFSRDHHTGLVHAKQLMKAAQKTDSTCMEIVAQFLEAWENDIQCHFQFEEILLLPFMKPEENKRLLEEHRSIRGLVEIVKSFQQASQVRAEVLRDLGAQLQNHIRWEERELFPSLEESLNHEQLHELQKKTVEMEKNREIHQKRLKENDKNPGHTASNAETSPSSSPVCYMDQFPEYFFGQGIHGDQDPSTQIEINPDVSAGKLVSLQIGRAHQYPRPDARSDVSKQQSWTSAIRKTPIWEPVYCTEQGLMGDEQADREHHGGPDKAILCYSYEHYTLWKREYPDQEWNPGGFGENFTVTRFDEHAVHIGDIFEIGGIVVQASEPRQPCYKLARLWNMKELPNLIMQNNRSGWYCRVLQPGWIAPNDNMKKVVSGSEWSIADVAYIIRHVGDDFDRAEQLYQCEALSNFLRNFLRKTIDEHDPRKKEKKFFSLHTIRTAFKKP